MYTETLGRWHTVDLFVGLAYLSHRDVPEYPASDIASIGEPISLQASPVHAAELMVGSVRSTHASGIVACCIPLRNTTVVSFFEGK